MSKGGGIYNDTVNFMVPFGLSVATKMLQHSNPIIKMNKNLEKTQKKLTEEKQTKQSKGNGLNNTKKFRVLRTLTT
jgi:hypothetical protein